MNTFLEPSQARARLSGAPNADLYTVTVQKERVMNQSPGESVKFDNVTIFKEFMFGSGAYGAVYKAKCDDTVCAAKILHDTLCRNVDASRPSEQFLQEIRLVLKFNHPNIVQCLGVHKDPAVS